uniref:Uncharacterized protein n=1 Tax=Utricularia reniformis TaxID=192314 RepID=A0A1Y0AYR1_9LAMI|nr:hypothetical protein AEK19_MT0546 [Utricularia reniformis]ART30294.1 hypothetical protein AEK19_MT0546 [Utricularia reniformis]
MLLDDTWDQRIKKWSRVQASVVVPSLPFASHRRVGREQALESALKSSLGI